MKAVLSTTYFGPVQWYQKLNRFGHVLVEQHEHFLKQTYRNRCIIATTQGLQALTVPVEKPPVSLQPALNPSRGEGSLERKSDEAPLLLGSDRGVSLKDIRISNHGKWRKEHWHALQSAYGESPFFEFYEDDIRPFFEDRWEYLLDFNMAITRKMCELLDIHPHIELTSAYISPSLTGSDGVGLDFRTSIHPKHPQEDSDFIPKPYYQVYRERFGFQPNLSILDLLFNMGNEAVLCL